MPEAGMVVPLLLLLFVGDVVTRLYVTNTCADVSVAQSRTDTTAATVAVDPVVGGGGMRITGRNTAGRGSLDR